jgi:ABC-2 type transport system permease protein
LLKHFQASSYFAVKHVLDSYKSVTTALDRGDCVITIVIPPDFSERLRDSGQSSIQAILDATDDNTAAVATGYAQSVVSGFSDEVQLQFSGIGGASVAAAAPLSLEARVWYNEDLDSRNFIIPGVVAVVMALVGSQLTSLTISREWERGTMELLVSTPITSMELMIGKLLPYFAIGMLDATFCLGIAVWWFGVPFRGSLATLTLVTVLFLIVVLSIGYLVSVTIRTQLGASQIALILTMLPTMMLSGYTFPIDQMPDFNRPVTYLVYSRYYLTALKSIFLKGSGVVDLWFPILIMLLYAAAVGTWAARAFRKSLD